MKLGSIFRLSMRSLFARLIRFLFVVLIIGVSLSLFSVSLFFVQSSRYNRKACERLFQKDLSYCGIMYAFDADDIAESDDSSNKEKFCEEVEALPEVECLGLSSDFYNNFPQKISDIQAAYREQGQGASGVETTCITPDMMKIIPVEFSEKLEKEQIDSSKYSIILGSAYRSAVQLGECFTMNSHEFQVIGFLDKKQKWAVSELEFRGDVPELTSVFSAEWKVFRIDASGSIYTACIYYALQENADIRSFQDKVEKLAQQYRIEYDLVSIDQNLTEQEKMNKATAQSARLLFCFCIVISVVMILALQISSFYMNKREYGILYATGMSDRDIGKMLLLENAVQFVLAVLIPIPLFLSLFPWLFTQTDAWGLFKTIFYEIYFRYTMPFTVGLAVCLTLIISWISYQIFRSMTPVDLIRADE